METTVRLTVNSPPVELGPDKGLSEPKCYARSLGNCNGGISKEHFVSKTVLAQIGDTLDSKGINWISDKSIPIAAKALQVKCLCVLHNRFLSPLDELAGHVFEQILKFGTYHLTTVIVPGKHFELWILKVLLGYISTGKAGKKSTDLLSKSELAKWVRVLFQIEDFPENTGLHLNFVPQDKIKTANTVSLLPGYKENSLTGLELIFGGFTVYLTLMAKEIAFNPAHPRFSYVMHHPVQINKSKDGKAYPQAIQFEWK